MRMNLNFEDLRGFLAVAELGSFKAASDAIHISQSALSRRVAKLEDAIGVVLLERTTRRVELTPIGRSFVPKLRNIIDNLGGALFDIEEIHKQISSVITLVCVPSIVAHFLPDVIREFRSRYPEIQIRILDQASASIVENIERGIGDFGVTYIVEPGADVDFQPLIEDPFVLACPRDHALARRRKVTWAELAHHDVVTLAQGGGNRLLIDRALAKTSIRQHSACEVYHVPALISLVEAGLGIGVVPRMAMPPTGHHSLVSIPLHSPNISRTLGLIRRRGRALKPAAQRFYDLLLQARTLPVKAETGLASGKGARAKK